MSDQRNSSGWRRCRVAQPADSHLRRFGIATDWRLIYGDKEFFTVTKGFHNALQGGQFDLTEALRQEYFGHNRASAEAATDNYDIYIVHDPQPAALRHFVGAGKGKWIWRCHIDSSQPNQQVWEFLRPFIEEYDAAVFTMKAFQPENLGLSHVSFIPPAIDPLSTKNMELPEDAVPTPRWKTAHTSGCEQL